MDKTPHPITSTNSAFNRHWTLRDLRMGMPVYSDEGQEVGTVARCLEDHFVIEKGIFFRDEQDLSYNDIVNVTEEHGVQLVLSGDDLENTPADDTSDRASLGSDNWDDVTETRRDTASCLTPTYLGPDFTSRPKKP